MTTLQKQQFGKYLMLDKLAVGGMAELYRAMITGMQGFEKIIAIKKILPHLATEEELVNSFIAEAKLAALLHHQNIVQIYDFGSLDGSYFIAMEYLLGKDCKIINRQAKNKKKPLGTEYALYICSRICSGLNYAHNLKDFQGKPLNLIHRDISPQNILITYEGDVKIVDFGIAKAANQNTMTQMGMIKGKIAYMSPEQAGAKKIDNRSDIFSAGIILYELVTGEKMFTGDTMQILTNVREGKYSLPEQTDNKIPAAVFDIIKRALAREPSKRYQCCSDMQADIEKCLADHNMRPTAQGLAAYMKSLFSEEITEEEKTMRQIAESITHAAPKKEEKKEKIPLEKQPEKHDKTPPPPEIKKETPTDDSGGDKNTKKLLLIGGGGGAALLLIIVIMLFSGGGEEKNVVIPEPVEPPEQVSAAPQPSAETESTAVTTDQQLQSAVNAMDKNDFSGAIEIISALLKNIDNPDKQIIKLYIKALQGEAVPLVKTEPEKARKLLLKARDLDENNIITNTNLGHIYMHDKQYPEAVKAYQQVIAIAPNSPDILFNMGFIYASTADFSQAEQMFKKVVENKPSYLDEALFNLAMVQNKLGKKKESLLNAQQALTVNPDNKLAKKYIQNFKQPAK